MVNCCFTGGNEMKGCCVHKGVMSVAIQQFTELHTKNNVLDFSTFTIQMQIFVPLELEISFSERLAPTVPHC
jgi:hypothetical protein